MAKKVKQPPLFCGDFPPEIKDRCERIAGALRLTITELVAGLLDDETKALKSGVDAITKWHEGKLRSREILTSPNENGKMAPRSSFQSDAPKATAKDTRDKGRGSGKRLVKKA